MRVDREITEEIRLLGGAQPLDLRIVRARGNVELVLTRDARPVGVALKHEAVCASVLRDELRREAGRRVLPLEEVELARGLGHPFVGDRVIRVVGNVVVRVDVRLAVESRGCDRRGEGRHLGRMGVGVGELKRPVVCHRTVQLNRILLGSALVRVGQLIDGAGRVILVQQRGRVGNARRRSDLST